MQFIVECWICSYVTDSVVAVTVCMFLFILPSRKPNYFCLWNRSGMADALANCGLSVSALSIVNRMNDNMTLTESCNCNIYLWVHFQEIILVTCYTHCQFNILDSSLFEPALNIFMQLLGAGLECKTAVLEVSATLKSGQTSNQLVLGRMISVNLWIVNVLQWLRCVWESRLSVARA